MNTAIINLADEGMIYEGCCKRAFIVKMPEIVESKQYELFCNEQMIKSEFRQMWANKKRRRNISHLRGSVLGCTPK